MLNGFNVSLNIILVAILKDTITSGLGNAFNPCAAFWTFLVCLYDYDIARCIRFGTGVYSSRDRKDRDVCIETHSNCF